MTVTITHRTGPITPTAVFLNGAKIGHDYRPTDTEKRAINMAADMIVANALFGATVTTDRVLRVLHNAVASA